MHNFCSTSTTCFRSSNPQENWEFCTGEANSLTTANPRKFSYPIARMLSKSFTATSEGIKKAHDALRKRGWKQKDLLKELQIEMVTPPSRGTVSKFFNGRPVDREIFKLLCQHLELNPWQEVAGLLHPQSEVDALVQEIREKYQGHIQQQCGVIRVLDMPQPIKVDSVYVDVSILNKPYGYTWWNIEQLSGDLPDSDFYNAGIFSSIPNKQERRSGLEVAQEYDKLIILGKPGSGKTTFLKYLAVCCNSGQFRVKDELTRVTVFISLREYSETSNQPSLFAYIQQNWSNYGATDPKVSEAILKAGRGLILFDGLDEVAQDQHDRILREIKYFSNRFYKNYIVISCRVAASEYRLEQFTVVEIADFDNEQIRDFLKRWFSKTPEKVEFFWKRLQGCKRIKELAHNPLLLILLCLIFEDLNDFPENRSELYRAGIELLLKRWDEQRNVSRSNIYKELSLQKKLDLLSYIAFNSFKEGQYLFKQNLVEKHITEYLKSLIPDVDSRAVLKAIEVQHGLLVERAREVYSFSHLTFQEYLTARRCATNARGLQYLAAHITEESWREVFMLTIGILSDSEQLTLFGNMKDNLIQSLNQDETLKNFLNQLRNSCSGADFKQFLAAILDSALAAGATCYSSMSAVAGEKVAAKNTKKTLLFSRKQKISSGMRVETDLVPGRWPKILINLQKSSRKFSNEQWNHLQQYYKSARILMDCLSISNISEVAKREILDAAGLPSSCVREDEKK